MRSVTIRSMDDIDALPEGEWVQVPGGLHAKFFYEVDRRKGTLTVALPREFARGLRGTLRASIRGKRIVIEKA